MDRDVVGRVCFLILTSGESSHKICQEIPIQVVKTRRRPIRPCLVRPGVRRLLVSFTRDGRRVVAGLTHFRVRFRKVRPFVSKGNEANELLIGLRLVGSNCPPVSVGFTSEVTCCGTFSRCCMGRGLSTVRGLFTNCIGRELSACLGVLGDG